MLTSRHVGGRHPRSLHSAAGFSLVEVAIAAGLLASALVAGAQLVAMAIAANTSARNTTYAAVLAEQKIEQLRALAWGFDARGIQRSHIGLSTSPATALRRNTPGYVDYVDSWGAPLDGGEAPPVGAVYFRRWSIEPLRADPDRTLIIQVLVGPIRDAGAADRDAAWRLAEHARVMTIRTRKAP